MSDYQIGTRVADREKTGEMSGENPGAEARAPVFPFVCVLVPPTCPRGDGGPRQGGMSRRWARQRPCGGATGCGGEIDERPREEGFSGSLSPPILGKTEVTRELD
jgi:hypothetical protein